MRAFLALIALAPPLCTVLRLLQMKEWRIGRLADHLRREGFAVQLFGTWRLWFLVLWLIGATLRFGLTDDALGAADKLSFVLLLGLAAISVLQILTGKQRMPVWTGKTILVMTVSLGIPVILGALLLQGQDSDPLLLSFLPVFAPLWAFLGWLVVLPLDLFLKRRLIAKATAIREARPKLRVIGITGSVGKTTMKELLLHLLKDRGAVATPAHVNSELGVASWLLSVLRNEPKASDKIIIVEMGAYKIGEIALLCRIAKPTLGIITYVGSQHLSLFGSRDNILQAKGELFAALPKTGHAIGNADNDVFPALKMRAGCTVTSVGTGLADVRAFDIEETPSGLSLRAFETTLQTQMRGSHNAVNILMAVEAARLFGLTPADAQKKLRSFSGLRGTFELTSNGGVTVLNDTYNSSPDSVKAAIRWAEERPETEKILVLEGIIELGDEEAAIHEEIATEARQVFQKVYVGNPEFLPYFTPVFGHDAALAADASVQAPGSLVVLSGRLRPSIIERFLTKE